MRSLDSCEIVFVIQDYTSTISRRTILIVTILEHGILLFMLFGLCILRDYYNRGDYLSFGEESVKVLP